MSAKQNKSLQPLDVKRSTHRCVAYAAFRVLLHATKV